MSQLYRLRAEPARAIAAIERALKLDESRKSYWYRAGELYQWTEDPDRARSAYETALRLDPGFRQATVALQRLTDQ